MKKKVLIPIIIVVCVLVVGVIGFILWKGQETSTITLEINPSIQLTVKKNGLVKKVEGLNDDGKEVVSKDLVGQKIEDALQTISDRIIEKEYILDDQVFILLHVEGKLDVEEVRRKVSFPFEDKRMFVDVTVIEEITKKIKNLQKN